VSRVKVLGSEAPAEGAGAALAVGVASAAAEVAAGAVAEAAAEVAAGAVAEGLGVEDDAVLVSLVKAGTNNALRLVGSGASNFDVETLFR
jgi:hypothetical protein